MSMKNISKPLENTTTVSMVQISTMNKWFGTFYILKNVSLTVKVGKIFFIFCPFWISKHYLYSMHQAHRRI